MKAVYEVLIVAAVLGAAELIWMETHADQATVDEGVDLAKSLQGGVQNLATTTGTNTVPGYNGTNLPQVQYFNTQNLDGMQTDATVQLGTGTASEASQYAYQQSLLPGLNFNTNDPILTHSSGISTDAILNPEVLTVPTGNCTVANVNNPETRIEHCTAWILPTNHTCNKTLDVDVTWQDQSSCAVGTTFNEIATGLPDPRDFVRARAVCNPGSGPDAVELEIHAHGQNAGCTGWTRITASTDQPLPLYTGVVLRPNWFGGCRIVPAFVSGGCAGNSCHYTIDYYELRAWHFPPIGSTCPFPLVNLQSMGFNGLGIHGQSDGAGNYCAREYTVNLSFEKPTITHIPTITENWTNGCAALEAQL